ncbi:hypothetical protein ACWZJV_09070 [Nocardioides sp. WG-D5]
MSTTTRCEEIKHADDHDHTCDLPEIHETRHGHHCPDCDVWWLQVQNVHHTTRHIMTADGQGLLW